MKIIDFLKGIYASKPEPKAAPVEPKAPGATDYMRQLDQWAEPTGAISEGEDGKRRG
jgi:hypothetical protein